MSLDVRATLRSGVMSLLARVPSPAASGRRAVILYHSVDPISDFPSTTRPALFEEHMAWLRERCHVIRFAQVLDPRPNGGDPRPMVAITFDDAFANNYTYALPVLRKFEIPATFFVATGLVDRERDVIEARSWRGWRDEGSTLSWEQILELNAAGMEIGSHGHSHRTLAQLDDAEVASDLRISKETLEDRLGTPIVSLAYPKGRPRRDFSVRTMEVARALGYVRAGAVHLRGVRRSDHPMSIPRFPIGDDPLRMLEAKIVGRLDLIGDWQERAPSWMFQASGGGKG